MNRFSLILLCLLPIIIQAQYRFDFEATNQPKVFQGGDSLINAWAGGINYTSATMADLTFDGKEDLILYDRGAQLLTVFRATGTSMKFKYAPELNDFFPGHDEDFGNWLLMRDYNCDGKKDIFFGVDNEIRVYENKSNKNRLKFVPINNGQALQTRFSSGPNNLRAASSDLPAIDDVDGDGDLDILAFAVNNTRVLWHENKKKCGLDFENFDDCYGDFQESGIFRSVTLDACGYGKKEGGQGVLHAGSSITTLDLNDDNLKDMLLGNVSFSSLTALYNGGSPDTANFDRQDTLFPSSKPVDLYIYPAAYYEDVTGDGVSDLLVSSASSRTSDANPIESFWLYENLGKESKPNFKFIKENFLQDQMIEIGGEAVPRFVDLNGDSLQDLVVATGQYYTNNAIDETRLMYYENTGAQGAPEFTLRDSNMAQLPGQQLGTNLVPAFGDLDNDGDQDFYVGTIGGTLHKFENTGSATNPQFKLTQLAVQNIDVGAFSSPYLFDFDQDGDLDLFIGNQKGRVYHYENTSQTNANFNLVSDFFGAVGVNKGSLRGFSQPALFRDSTGAVRLIVGSEFRGGVLYEDVENVSQQPALLGDTLGYGNIISSGFKETPFGISRNTGRNQFLIRSSELQNAGFRYGFIRTISFDIETSDNALITNGINIRMKNVNQSSISTFDDNMTSVVRNKPITFGRGWNKLSLQDRFLWDGQSDLLIEVCFSSNFINPDVKVRMNSTSFDSHAYGDITGYNNLQSNGCTMPVEKVIQKRPNLKLEMTPAFREQDQFFMNGRRIAADYADLNEDGFMEAVVGNKAGGVRFFKGSVYDVGLEENTRISEAFDVFPNPTTGTFTVKLNKGALSDYDQIEIYDIRGRMLSQKAIEATQTRINMKPKPGLYLIVVKGKNSRMTRKLVVR